MAIMITGREMKSIVEKTNKVEEEEEILSNVRK